MKEKWKNRYIALLLVTAGLLCTVCTACGGQGTQNQQKTQSQQKPQENLESGTASVMKLIKTEGSIGINDEEGGNVPLNENMQLYSGYGLKTKTESFAWINLDSAKLAKMDEVSDIEIQKSGKDLAILVNVGNVFFQVTEPLEEDETMEIHTSTMTVGIRGTCGWVEVIDENHMKVYILEGKVECSITEKSGKVVTAYVSAGEMAEMVLTEDGNGEITTELFDRSRIPGFVQEELDEEELETMFSQSRTEEPGESAEGEGSVYEEYRGWYTCDENGGTLFLFKAEGGGYMLHGERPLSAEEREQSPGSVSTGILECELELRDGVFYGMDQEEGAFTITPDNAQLILEGTEIGGVYRRDH